MMILIISYIEDEEYCIRIIQRSIFTEKSPSSDFVSLNTPLINLFTYPHIAFTCSMASNFLKLLLFLFLHCLLLTASSSNQIPKPYVVYMGSSSNIENGDGEFTESAHLQLLSSIIPSKKSDRISLIHHYKHAFKGFSAMLTEKEASLLSEVEGIVSVFPDRVLQLHTTRSWDFLEEAAAQPSISTWASYNYHKHSSDVIIGVIDTGIWPESESFKDQGLGEIPARWKGVCMESRDFKKSNCNRKLIGARFYKTLSTSKRTAGSPRDFIGHGTHTASTAAGARVANASYFGLARGTARGGSPSSRIASYQACSESGCSGATLLKAIDDAVEDGVDIISISIGMSSLFQSDYLSDPIAIGAFHAEQNGVMVVCSAGNDGPDPSTVVNTAPWVLTVAASTIDRNFESTIVLGNGKTIQGPAISLSNLSHTKTYPLAFGKDIAAYFTPEAEAKDCRPGSLDAKKVEGKIIVCLDNDPSIPRRIKKLVAEDAKAKGLIFVNEEEKGVPFDSGIFPFSQVGNSDWYQIVKYINSTKNPTATILSTVDVPKYNPAPVVAYFSSRGPGAFTENILKPDVAAPGVAILAAIVPKEGTTPNGNKPANYGLGSGTSMACPHVTGSAAFIKSLHPDWTSSMIKSALMTTATYYDNIGKPINNSSGNSANPHEMGVGEISPLKALNPGLVFETTTKDYLRFLCYYGYSNKIIKSMANTNFNCSKNSIDKLISNINYPSISIDNIERNKAVRTVRRTVTNVGSTNATYTASVQAPSGLVVNVYPKKISFGKDVKRASFKVSFNSKEASSGYNFGSITWWEGRRNSVRIVFAVNVE
ncbi:CO(2)-response secreted protease-like isoform X2 [Mangifera indica]|uniref:CO(2)-response secreted protease-like isoform X2 n=1 Tax=Mangifera indica TaxID=29780 RepID=UPI001CFA7199|nr:CO(2)-response secreted protease-like isoform X2 [Mangifera indica]